MSRLTCMLSQAMAGFGAGTAIMMLILVEQTRTMISPWLTVLVTVSYIASVICDGVKHQAKSGG